jgi:hypothetical protein
MPTATDLVTDLPADFEVFGQAVATSMADLLGGTTGQILAKNSATDMDFVWIANDQGDLTAITAGTGISVTSPTGPIPTVAIDSTVATLTGTQTLTNKTLTSPALTTPTISTATTNGDLLYGTGSGALQRLGIGSASQVLTVTAGIPAWATPAGGGGKVLQVLSTAVNTFQAINSATYVDFTNFTLTITPSAVSSKILIFISVNGWDAQSQTVANPIRIALRNGSNTVLNNPYDWYAPVSNSVTYPKAPNGLVSQSYLDSPATTSAVTYKVSGLNTSAPGSGFYMNNGATSSMTIMEIGA